MRDILSGCLVVEPSRRRDAETLLRHKHFNSLHRRLQQESAEWEIAPVLKCTQRRRRSRVTRDGCGKDPVTQLDLRELVEYWKALGGSLGRELGRLGGERPAILQLIAS